MPQTRKTIEMQTPSGHAFVLNEYMTGREGDQLRSLSTKYIKVGARPEEGIDGKLEMKPSVESIDSEAIERETNEMTIKFMVVSIDGLTDGVLDTVLDLPDTDYLFILESAKRQSSNPTVAK